MSRRWQCSVCSHIETGDEPPDQCPICGADRAEFSLLEEARPGLLREIRENFRVHQVAAHFPAGLIPTGLLFLALSMLFASEALGHAAFWLLLVVTAVVPVSAISGLYDWRKRFKGARAGIFFRKIGLALLLMLICLGLILLQQRHPEMAVAWGWPRMVFLAGYAVATLCVILLGHYGSILVYRWQGPGSPGDRPTDGEKSA